MILRESTLEKRLKISRKAAAVAHDHFHSAAIAGAPDGSKFRASLPLGSTARVLG